MNIIVDHHLSEFYRKPRSKRRRVINKWKKRTINHRPATKAVICGDMIICTPALACKLREIEREESNRHNKLIDTTVMGLIRPVWWTATASRSTIRFMDNEIAALEERMFGK